MKNLNKIEPLTGVKATKKREYVWLFAIDREDFTAFCGNGFFLKGGGEYDGKFACQDAENNVLFIFGQDEACIRGRRNIQAHFTEKFKATVRAQRVKREVDICNFQSTQHINYEILPKVIKELMAEEGNHKGIASLVGHIIKVKRSYSAIEVNSGDIGVVYNIYGKMQDHCDVIFSNGQWCGFSKTELAEDTELLHMTKHADLQNFKYTDSANLEELYNLGFFDREFYPHI